jgi:hypothetical protein
VLVIRLGNLRLHVAHVGDVKSSGLQTLDKSRGAQRGGRALMAGRENGSAGRGADNRNLPWLPNNLYGQRKLLRKNAVSIKVRLRDYETCLLLSDSNTVLKFLDCGNRLSIPYTVSKLRDCATQSS